MSLHFNQSDSRSSLVTTLSDAPTIMEEKLRLTPTRKRLVRRHDIILEKLKKFWESSSAMSSLRDSA